MDDRRRETASKGVSATLASRRALFGVLAGTVLIARERYAIPARAQITPPTPAPGACDPAATSGIAGLVLIGPMCPVVTQDDPCPDRPFAATLLVQDAFGNGLCEAWSGEDGRFRVGLPPGEYLLVPVGGEAGLPYASPLWVTVLPNQYTEVTVGYDSGIR